VYTSRSRGFLSNLTNIKHNALCGPINYKECSWIPLYYVTHLRSQFVCNGFLCCVYLTSYIIIVYTAHTTIIMVSSISFILLYE
jgi:hypothetical protein